MEHLPGLPALLEDRGQDDDPQVHPVAEAHEVLRVIFVGIDPGKHGAVALMDEQRRGIELHACPLGPDGDYDRAAMLGLLRHIFAADSQQPAITLELVHSMPHDGVVQAFDFGRGYGYWQMACTAVGVEPMLVRPEEWKREMLAGLPSGKRSSVEQAIRLFPDASIRNQLYGPRGGLVDGKAEALLLAELGRRRWRLGGKERR